MSKINFLEVTPLTEVEIKDNVQYNEEASWVASRILSPFVPSDAPLGDVMEEVLAALTPWTPVHPKEGRMSKRISKIMAVRFKASVDPAITEAVSTYLGGDTPSGSFLFDITDDFSWKSGEFGDDGSCFFNNPSIFPIFRENGGMAIRFYSGSAKSPKGASRALVAPTTYGDVPMVFNAYGASLKQFMQRIKAITDGEADVRMVKATGVSPVTVNLSTALLVAYEGSKPELVRLPVKLPLDPEIKFRCGECGNRYDLRNLTIVPATRKRVCQPCLDSVYMRCVHGGGYLTPETGTKLPYSGRWTDKGREGAVEYWTSNRYVDRLTRCTLDPTHYPYPGCGVRVALDGKRVHACVKCAIDAGYNAPCRYCGTFRKGREKCPCPH